MNGARFRRLVLHAGARDIDAAAAVLVAVAGMAPAAAAAAHSPTHATPASFWFFVTGAMSIAPAIIFCRRLIETRQDALRRALNGDETTIAEDCGRLDEAFLASPADLLRSGGFALFADYVYQIADFAGSHALLSRICIIASAFSAWMALTVVFRAVVVISKIGRRYDFDLTVYEEGVLIFGDIILKAYLVIIAIVLQYQFTVLLFPSGAGLFGRLTSLPILLIGLPTIGFVFGSFFFCQWGFHKRLVALKAAQRRRLGPFFAIYRNGEGQLSYDDLIRLNYARAELQHLERIPDWPVGRIGNITATLTAVISAVMPTVLQPLFGT
jgi:hypothetical protein